MDQLSSLLGTHGFYSKVFFNGDFCGSNTLDEEGKAGHLHIIRRGQIAMHHEDRPALQVQEPAIVFYPRGLHHRLATPNDASTQLLCARIHFDGSRQNPMSKALPDCLYIPLAELPFLSGLLDLLFHEADGGNPGKEVTLEKLCDVVAMQAIRYAYDTGRLSSGTLAGLSDTRLARALVMMHNEPAHPWTLNNLAELCGMSRSKFAKYFHDVVAMTPGDYLTDRRMLLAKSLLRKNRQVKTVAIDTGYASQPAFTRAFTAKFGVSPTDWLKTADRAARSENDD